LIGGREEEEGKRRKGRGGLVLMVDKMVGRHFLAHGNKRVLAMGCFGPERHHQAKSMQSQLEGLAGVRG
jgi:hypothetical protein